MKKSRILEKGSEDTRCAFLRSFIPFHNGLLWSRGYARFPAR